MATASTELEVRRNRATERRKVIKGALEGSEAGPTGAALGAARAARSSRKKTTEESASGSSGTRPSRARRAAGATGRYAGKRAGKFAMARLEGPASGALFAEYFGGALIIATGLFTKGPSKGYLDTMAEIMMRLTALTMVFFVLFLMTGSKRGGQAAIWLGLIIDLGIIFTAARGQHFTTLASEVSGKGSGIELTAMQEGLKVPETPPGVQLPDE